MRKKPTVLFVTTEINPLVKVGGLADFSALLVKAMKSLKVDIRVILPYYGLIGEAKNFKTTSFGLDNLSVNLPLTDKEIEEKFSILETKIPNNIPVYLVFNKEFFSDRSNVYGYRDDAKRWYFFALAIIEFLKKNIFSCEVIHCNDAVTGFLPNLMHFEKDRQLLKIARVFTIHNISYQGSTSAKNFSEVKKDQGSGKLPPFSNDETYLANTLKRGIIYSDIISTVSENYAREILTPEYGMGLEKLLLELRTKLIGITNGLDTEYFNPKTDQNLYYRYDSSSINKKLKNKVSLQNDFGLRENAEIPLIGFIGRFTSQKGLELIIPTVERLMSKLEFQFVFVGDGDFYYTQELYRLSRKFPKRIAGYLANSRTIARRIYAASDIFLYPSRFEPCGIAQLIAMRYGSIPIVRKTGGLADTVEEMDVNKNKGTGFLFEDFSETDFLIALVKALSLYSDRNIWQKIVKRVMEKDFSWQASAQKYLLLYKKAIKNHHQKI